MRSGFLVLMTLLAGCHSCDSGYEIPAPAPAPLPSPPPATPADPLATMPSAEELARSALGAQPPRQDACRFFTADDATALLGGPVVADSSNAAGPISCTYTTTASTPTAVIAIVDFYSGLTWDAMKPEAGTGAVAVKLPNGDGWRMAKELTFGVHVGMKSVIVTSSTHVVVKKAVVETVMANIAARL